jgi:hypothetical protein
LEEEPSDGAIIKALFEQENKRLNLGQAEEREQ